MVVHCLCAELRSNVNNHRNNIASGVHVFSTICAAVYNLFVFFFFGGVEVVKMWFGTDKSKRRVPVLGILLGGAGAILDYAAFLAEK